MKKILLSIISLFLFTFAFSGTAFAGFGGLSVDCSSGCTISGTNPLFSQGNDGYWYPGRILTKQIYFKNSSSISKNATMQPSKTSSTGELEKKMSVVLSKTAGPVIWSGSLENFFGSTIILDNLDAGASSLFDLSATMDPLAGNEYQDKETVFALKLGFWTEESEGSVQESSTGGGTGTGGSTPCTDTKPGTPVNLKIDSGPNPDQATLSWTKTAPFTYFLIAYSDNTLGPKWGNPDVGNGSSYTVSGLTNGTYYFWLRGHNGCMPGDFTGPVSIAIGTGTGTITELPGFQVGVLGEATSSAEINVPTATESGVEGVSTGICLKCIWWQVLLLEIAGLIIFGRTFKKNRLLILAFVPVLAYLIFLWLNRNCQSKSIFCQLFWLLDIIVFILYLIFPRLKKLLHIIF